MSDAIDPILVRAIDIAGGTKALAGALGIQAPSIYSWKRVPPNRVRAVAAATGIPPYVLRPDLYDSPHGAAKIDVAVAKAAAFAANKAAKAEAAKAADKAAAKAAAKAEAAKAAAKAAAEAAAEAARKAQAAKAAIRARRVARPQSGKAVP